MVVGKCVRGDGCMRKLQEAALLFQRRAADVYGEGAWNESSR